MLPACSMIRCRNLGTNCLVRARKLQVACASNASNSWRPYSFPSSWTELVEQPENFFDMRQAKLTSRTPDFKHKFKLKTAVWLNHDSPESLVQAIQAWDADISNSRVKPTLMLPTEELWKNVFSDPDMWYDKRPTENNSPAFVHKVHHFALWLNQWTPEWARAGVQNADASREAWKKKQLETGLSSTGTQHRPPDIVEEDESERWNGEKQQQAVEELLGSCAGNDFLESAEPPQGSLTVELLPHQKRALAWMLHREQPGTKPAVAGGLLADDQGLGKTLTAIALILAHPPNQEWLSGSPPSEAIITASHAQQAAYNTQEQENNQSLAAAPHQTEVADSSEESNGLHDSREGVVLQDVGMASAGSERHKAQDSGRDQHAFGGTLIVAPTNVITNVWYKELLVKIPEQAQLKIAVHHGTRRKMDPQELAEMDVVITSYDTLLSDHKRPDPVGLSNVIWWRVVLDEAQFIKNRHIQRSLAVYDLKAKHKRILSGTPIQNQVQELFSYFHFLQYHPFNTQAAFDKYIRNIENMKHPEHALERLREMLQPIMLRRIKGGMWDGAPIIHLPAKKTDVKRLYMSEEEKELYKSLKGVAEELIQARGEAGLSEAPDRPHKRKSNAAAKASSTFSALVMLMRLRQACIHHSLLPPELQMAVPSDITETDLGAEAQSPDDDCDTPTQTGVSYAEGLQRIQAMHTPSTKLTKILQIVQAAQQRPEGPQKVIVFSFFVGALHIMKDVLSHHNLGSTMLHGQMELHERTQALDRFKEDPNTVVLLASLRACGTGITVTCASEVVLMEPDWNPFVEHQAVDRVHRIGQKHDVTVHRLYMADTVEERILDLQERKLQMTTSVIEANPGAKRLLTAADYNALFS